jgi:hypothetical protein
MTITRDDASEFRCEAVLHCAMCLAERPTDVSPKDWSRLSFGSYHKPDEPDGIYLQLWCDRHDCNVTVIHIETEAWSHYDGVPLRVEGANDDNHQQGEDSNGLHS